MLSFSTQPVDMTGNRSSKKLSKTDYKNLCFIDGDVLKFLEGEENDTKQRKTRTDVAFVMTFRVYCGQQKQKQPTLAVSCFYHSEFERNFSLLPIIKLTLFVT